jgi:site-specific recombinase XerD
MVVVHGVRVAGPLAPYAEGLAGELARLGFKPSSARLQMQVAAHLSRWLAQAGLGAAALDGPVTDRYLASRRAAGYTAYLTLRALGPLLGYLRRLGVAPEPVRPGPATAAEMLLEEYRAWLLGERGVTPAVARGYLDLVRLFAERHAAGGRADLCALTAGDVTAFLTARSRRLAPKTAQRLATALRSLLRFWHLQGLIGGPLDRAVPKVANRRPGLPRPLEPGQVQAMLGSCDRAAAAGRRDLAMLTLMARMGLRAGEVAGLRLDDIGWRTGEITVRGKGNRRDQLPLTADAGEAMAAWLRDGRPSTALDRAVFTRVMAPHWGLTSGGVTMAVFAAGQRAGLGTVHAHRLRHSAATAMLSQGGSLTEIGQVLRHRRPMTTAIYAKADIAALRALARPWPGVS